MKHTRRLLLTLSVCLLLGTSQGMAQEKTSQTVLIRAFELPPLGGGRSSRMTVTSPDGSFKSTELAEIDAKTYDGAANNSVIIQKELDKWKKEGFEVDGLSTQTTLSGGIITTIVLSKD
ncbi:hypothetical protein [Fluviicola sp.]|uniref:hypothetical protein n=1 Tax=Fluviicola sp. TaxID=1917219 RepID=UPI0031D794FC